MVKNSHAILIVNDETAYADFLKRDLKVKFPAIDVNITDSGESALKIISDNSYDLIIAEMALPGMGGINFFLEIKELFPDVRTIMLSNHLSFKEKRLLEKEGVFGYLEKPFLIESLAEMVVEAMEV
jgi:DNA-binding NtrC family response regulator